MSDDMIFILLLCLGVAVVFIGCIGYAKWLDKRTRIKLWEKNKEEEDKARKILIEQAVDACKKDVEMISEGLEKRILSKIELISGRTVMCGDFEHMIGDYEGLTGLICANETDWMEVMCFEGHWLRTLQICP